MWAKFESLAEGAKARQQGIVGLSVIEHPKAYLIDEQPGRSDAPGHRFMARWILRCVVREDVVVSFRTRVSGGKAGLALRFVDEYAPTKRPKPQPPVAAYFFESLTMS